MLGEDFTEQSPLQVTFSSGDVVSDTACTTLGIINDDSLESDHEFTVNLGSITPLGPVTLAPSSTTVFINDDEGREMFLIENVIPVPITKVIVHSECPFLLTGATVTIVSSDYVVDESQSSVEVCTSLTDIPAGGLECEVVATISTMDGPLASMSFYMPQTQKVYLLTFILKQVCHLYILLYM